MPAPIVRFAPSPTGLIHIGNARTALLNALFARREGGTFILRFDDTDLERSTREYADRHRDRSRWLGIPPDMIVRQSERFDLYDAVAERLKTMGRLYACYETPDELERRRKRQLARGLPPIYDRAALSSRRTTSAGWKRRAAAALALPPRPPDRRLGPISSAASATSIAPRCPIPCWCATMAPTSTRCPPSPTTSTSAITHVIRGEDHVTNTAVQIQIFEALGAVGAGLRPP